MPALAVLAPAAAMGFVLVRRRRRAAACRTTPTRVDLGLPTVRPAPKDSAPTH
jgi:hypothetical protein